MRRDMDRTHGLVFSQRVLTSLIDKGLSRELAYDTVQPLAMQAWEQGTSFKELVSQSETVKSYLSDAEIDDCFDPSWHTKHVDTIFERLGL